MASYQSFASMVFTMYQLYPEYENTLKHHFFLPPCYHCDCSPIVTFPSLVLRIAVLRSQICHLRWACSALYYPSVPLTNLMRLKARTRPITIDNLLLNRAAAAAYLCDDDNTLRTTTTASDSFPYTSTRNLLSCPKQLIPHEISDVHVNKWSTVINIPIPETARRKANLTSRGNPWRRQYHLNRMSV